MNSRVWIPFSVAVSFFVVATPASAHIALTCPPARYAYSAQGIKTGPCGATSGSKSNKVTHLIAGQQLTVTFTETIGHPGFFRISLDTTGAEGFPAISKTPMNPVVAPVLADNILPHTTAAANNTKRMATITVPSTTCAKCVLQLTQFMSDNPTSGYYECADVVIDAAGSGADFACDGGAMGMGGKSGAGGKTGMGGSQGAGGSTGSGGATGSGGDTHGSGGVNGGGTGGASSSGGATSSGGASSSGGATGSGGTTSSGGATGSGGVSASGGVTASGGSSSSGGTTGSGGSHTDGSGGASSTGSGGGKGATDDGAGGGCAYARADAEASIAAVAAALAALLLALRRRPARR